MDDSIARRVVLPVLSACSFSAIFNMTVVGPVLVDISSDLHISVAVAGTLTAGYALPAAFMALVFGPLSDRYGRYPLMLFGILSMTLGSLGAVIAPSFYVLLVCRILAGLGAAALQPSIFAAVGDYFPYAERGRAMSWVIGANQLATIFGIPTGTLLAGLISWRLTFALLALVLLVITVLLVTRFPRTSPNFERSQGGLAYYLASYRPVLQSRSAMAVLVAQLLGGTYWYGWTTYMGAFFIQTFSLPTAALAPIVVLQGLGSLLGSNLGGRFGDRYGKKQVLLVALLASAALMAPLTSINAGVWLAIVLNTVFAIPCGARFTSANTLATEMVPSARGTMMSLNTSIQQLGAMIGSTFLGMLIGTSGGYSSIGLATSAIALGSAAVLYLFVSEAPARVGAPAYRTEVG